MASRIQEPNQTCLKSFEDPQALRTHASNIFATSGLRFRDVAVMAGWDPAYPIADFTPGFVERVLNTKSDDLPPLRDLAAVCIVLGMRVFGVELSQSPYRRVIITPGGKSFTWTLDGFPTSSLPLIGSRSADPEQIIITKIAQLSFDELGDGEDFVFVSRDDDSHDDLLVVKENMRVQVLSGSNVAASAGDVLCLLESTKKNPITITDHRDPPEIVRFTVGGFGKFPR